MRVVLFGATGMIGSGVLIECLDDPRIEQVVSVVRHPSGVSHPKLRELVHDDFLDYVPICAEFAGVDACLFCLGVSSAGMNEADYRRVTHDFTLAAAKEILAESPHAAFCYVSGAGTDGTGRGRVMWARVKGQTEKALLAMGFHSAFMFRPGYIQPMKGVRSKTALYQMVYNIAGAVVPPDASVGAELRDHLPSSSPTRCSKRQGADSSGRFWRRPTSIGSRNSTKPRRPAA